MILTGSEISRNVALGRIIIDPFSVSQVNPNSYNYRLGDRYIRLDNDKCDLSESSIQSYSKHIPVEGLLLKPGYVYLCNTKEVIGSDYYVTSLIGKSSMGRLGLFLQLSADLGHQGEIHRWTLELRPTMPIIIYPNMIIGQVSFWKVSGKPISSNGYYTKFDEPTPSRGVKL